MSHPDGIVLSRSGSTWVSVSNPHRDQSAVDQAWEKSQHSTGLEVGRAAGIAVTAGAVVAIISLALSAPVLLAGGLALATVAASWFLASRLMHSRQQALSKAQADATRELGPRRILRGSLVGGHLADAADDVVMASASILQSDAVREGALGDPADVYRDLMDATWALLWRCSVLDADQHQYARTFLAASRHVDPADLDVESEYLQKEHDAAANDLAPLIDEHLRLADTVAGLEQLIRIPAARASLQRLTSSRIAAPEPHQGHQSLAARASAAQTLLSLEGEATSDADEPQGHEVSTTLDEPQTRQER